MPQANLFTNFSSLTTIEEVKARLDVVFAQLQDQLNSNPTTHSLLNAKAPVPTQKAGDFVLDYRDNKLKVGMSDGKDIVAFDVQTFSGNITDEQHGIRASRILDGNGNLVGYLHPNATGTVSGFMSAIDKARFDNLDPSSADPTDCNAANPSAGVAVSYSRSDHRHQILVGTPVGISTINFAGTANTLARSDHQHLHGALAGGALHALATGSANGFMSAIDKVELNRLNALNLDMVLSGGQYYLTATSGGVTKQFGPGF